MKFIEFKYRYHSRDEKALVLDRQGSWSFNETLAHFNRLHLFFHKKISVLVCRVAHQTKSELEALIEKMRSAKLHTVNLTDNDLVKDHSTHLVTYWISSNLCYLYCYFLNRRNIYIQNWDSQSVERVSISQSHSWLFWGHQQRFCKIWSFH